MPAGSSPRLCCFNPRSREGSDTQEEADYAVANLVSIHAPAKGATEEEEPFPPLILSFNPRSREGSDGDELIVNGTFVPLFQSTLPRRERRSEAAEVFEVETVSIHAPAKGATVCQKRLVFIGIKFQSTLPRRERRLAGKFGVNW